MKTNNKIKKCSLLVMVVLSSCLISCDDYLDKEPKSQITPEAYFTQASQLENYANSMYANILPSHSNWSYGIFGEDNNTDNQTSVTVADRYTADRWKVDMSENSNWDFEQIYRCNFFFSETLPKFGEDMSGSTNKIVGELASVKHYIGEVYFLRAYEYFKRYQLFGDFPIVTKPLSDNKEVLNEALKRMPRNEVA
ncbi:MAG: RagB/SusD family nutrient uptake outer membrane protein, partial [Bacteroidaceae bacterium]